MDRLDALRHGMTLAYWADEAPDRMAVISPAGNRTFAELNARHQPAWCGRCAAARPQGGRRVALMCTNRPEFVEVLDAGQRAGFRLTPINWHLTGEEAAYIVETARPRRSSPTRGSPTGGRRPPQTGAPAWSRCYAIGGFIAGLREVRRRCSPPRTAPTSTTRSSARQMLYTSGTTGRPKGVHRDGAAAAALAAVNFCGYDEDLRRQRRRAPADRPAVPRRPAGLLGGRAAALRRAHRAHGPLGRRARRCA